MAHIPEEILLPEDPSKSPLPGLPRAFCLTFLTSFPAHYAPLIWQSTFSERAASGRCLGGKGPPNCDAQDGAMPLHSLPEDSLALPNTGGCA